MNSLLRVDQVVARCVAHIPSEETAINRNFSQTSLLHGKPMHHFLRTSIFVVAGTLFSYSALAASQLPALPVATLSGQPFALPVDLANQPCLFIIGFTHASRPKTLEWSTQLRNEYAKSSAASIYDVVVLEDVPGLMRSFVTGRVAADVPVQLHDHYLVVTQQERVWKQLVSFAEADTAYVLLLNARHEVVWHGSGALHDDNIAALTARVRAINADQGTQQ